MTSNENIVVTYSLSGLGTGLAAWRQRVRCSMRAFKTAMQSRPWPRHPDSLDSHTLNDIGLNAREMMLMKFAGGAKSNLQSRADRRGWTREHK